jgi:hypothetical protein
MVIAPISNRRPDMGKAVWLTHDIDDPAGQSLDAVPLIAEAGGTTVVSVPSRARAAE